MLRYLQTTAGVSPTGVHRDREVSPKGTLLASRQGPRANGFMKHPQLTANRVAAPPMLNEGVSYFDAF